MADPQHPDFYNKTRGARKIIVVDLGFLGDSVHLIPALWEVKSHYPAAEIDVLTTAVGAEVLRLAGCVHEAIVFPLGPKSPPWWSHWSLLKVLRENSYDLLFNFSGADRTVFISFITGARWRAGHFGSRRHFWSKWLIPVWVDRRDRDLPVYEQRRQVLTQLGMKPAPSRFSLQPDSGSLAWAGENFDFPFLHFSVNASSYIKEWPLENWIQLAVSLLKCHPQIRIVATGNSQPREREKLARLLQAVADPRMAAWGDTLSMPRLAAMLARSKAHVGADSGVLHLAWAAGAPTVSIFRKHQGLSEWAPSGPRHFRAEAECRCLNEKEFSCSEVSGALCLREIRPAVVQGLVEEAMALS